jgi:hypothetical protein
MSFSSFSEGGGISPTNSYLFLAVLITLSNGFGGSSSDFLVSSDGFAGSEPKTLAISEPSTF